MLELIFNFHLPLCAVLHHTDSSHDELPEEINTSKLFMAILGEVANPSSSVANSSRAHVPVFIRCLETPLVSARHIMIQIRKQRRRGLNFTGRSRVLSNMRRPIISSLGIAAFVSREAFFVFYTIFCL